MSEIPHSIPETEKNYPGKFSKVIERDEYPVMREEFRKGLDDVVEKTKGDIIITSHIMPDDDAMCSALAQKRILEKQHPNKKFRVIFSEKPVDAWDALLKSPDEVTWAAKEKIKDKDGKERPGDIIDHVKSGDALICLDGGTFNRFSRMQEAFENNPPFNTVILDHHRDTPSPAGLSYVEPEANATAELVSGMHDIGSLDPDVCELLWHGIISDTRNFSFEQDYTQVKAVAEKLQKRSGKSVEELSKRIKHSEQEKAYKEIFEKHTTKVQNEGLPAISYSYITPSEYTPEKETVNPEYDFFIARRDYMYEQTQKGDAELYWTLAPVRRPNNELSNRYSISFRRRNDSQLDLHTLASSFNGGGHGGAAAGMIEIPIDTMKHIQAQKKANSAFDETTYVAELMVNKVKDVLTGNDKQKKEETYPLAQRKAA